MNTFSIEYQKYKESELATRLEQKYSDKPYYLRYASIKTLTLIASYLFNVFSALTAATLVYFFAFDLIGYGVPSFGVSFVFLALLEVFKRYIGCLIFKEAFQRHYSIPLMLTAVGLLLLSVSFSYGGAKKIVDKFTPPVKIEATTAAELQLLDQIQNIDTQVADARKTQWRGTTTRTSQKTIESLAKTKAALQQRLIEVQAKTDSSNEQLVQEHNQSTRYKAEYFALFTLILELCFLLCCCFLEYYDFRSYAEFASGKNLIKPIVQKVQPSPVKDSVIKIDTPSNQDVANNNKQLATSIPNIDQRKFAPVEPLLKTEHPPAASNKIATVARAVKKVQPTTAVVSRECQLCSKDISHKRKDAKYCDGKCRKQAHLKK